MENKEMIASWEVGGGGSILVSTVVGGLDGVEICIGVDVPSVSVT